MTVNLLQGIFTSVENLMGEKHGKLTKVGFPPPLGFGIFTITRQSFFFPCHVEAQLVTILKTETRPKEPQTVQLNKSRTHAQRDGREARFTQEQNLLMLFATVSLRKMASCDYYQQLIISDL